MLRDERAHRLLVVGQERLQRDELHVAPRGEAAVLVEDVRDAAAHAGREVAPGRAEDDDAPAGHVLAAVVADALDDGHCAGVAHAEALAADAAEERLAARRAVERDVADDDVLLGAVARLGRRPNGDRAAGEALAAVVVGVAPQREAHAGRQPAAERLARRAAEGHLYRALAQPVGAVARGDGRAEDPADAAVDVANGDVELDAAALLDRLARALHE